jgi:solute carrier family 25 carnitine/acylcarnitine transporter 20/29
MGFLHKLNKNLNFDLSTVFYFLVYYGMKGRLLGEKRQEAGVLERTCAELIAGGTAGVLSWGSVIPVDVVKTHIQTDSCLRPSERRYRGSLHCAQEILRSQGFGGFTRGGLPLLLRAFPVNAITFFTYERVLSMLV